MTATAPETRVYTITGKRAHLLDIRQRPDSWASALCGLSPIWHTPWLGTGSQAEHEKAAALPTCKYCAQQAERIKAQEQALAASDALAPGDRVRIYAPGISPNHGRVGVLVECGEGCRSVRLDGESETWLFGASAVKPEETPLARVAIGASDGEA